MTKRSLPVLILLNAVLLAALSVTAFSPPAAEAQFSSGGQYLMISGKVRGRSQQAAVYIIDLRSSRMAAVLFNSANDKINIVAGTNIRRDMERFDKATR